MLHDHQLAEDAAQEAFARGLVSLPRLKETGKFAAWLARICRNVAIDIVRTRPPQLPPQEVASPQDDGVEELTLQKVREAIARLPGSLKEVTVLRYYHDCSYEQISAVLGLSKMAINGRLTRAKRKLIRDLRRRGVLEDMA